MRSLCRAGSRPRGPRACRRAGGLRSATRGRASAVTRWSRMIASGSVRGSSIRWDLPRRGHQRLSVRGLRRRRGCAPSARPPSWRGQHAWRSAPLLLLKLPRARSRKRVLAHRRALRAGGPAPTMDADDSAKETAPDWPRRTRRRSTGRRPARWPRLRSGVRCRTWRRALGAWPHQACALQLKIRRRSG